MVRKSNVKVFYVISSWNFDVAYLIIKNKKKLNGKVIFDDYDVFSGMMNELEIEKKFPDQFHKERICLENADGLCCRSLETQFPKHQKKLHINGKRIFFPEYMWNIPENNFVDTSKEKILIYVGNFNNEIVKLANKMDSIGWKLEIFPAHNVNSKKLNIPANIKIHLPVSSKLLIKKIKQYRIAIQLPGFFIDPKNIIYTNKKIEYATSGKIFDYMEAGLKVLIADELFQKWILSRYGMAIEIDINNFLDDVIRKLATFEALRFNINEHKYSHLILENQAKRLDSFVISMG